MKNHILFIPALIALFFTSCSTTHFSQAGRDAFTIQSGVQATPPAAVSAPVEMSRIEPEMVNLGHSSMQLRPEFQIPPFDASEKVMRKTARAEMQQFTREQKKELRKAILYAYLGKEMPEPEKAGSKDGAPFIDQTAAAIIAFFIPPLGAGLYFGKDKRTWISLGLTLLFWLPGAIYSIIVILKD